MPEPNRVALVPARGGSRGLPRKNLVELAGRPLIAHSIVAAIESGCFARVVVTSEDPEILEQSARWGAETLVRPAELATDDASTLDVIAHALGELRAEEGSFALLQPTSPLRTKQHIVQAVKLLGERRGRSLVSVTPSEHPPQKSLVVDEDGTARALFDWASLTTPRQLLQPTYRVNGAIYMGESGAFLSTRNLFAAPLVLYEMSAAISIDIDSEADLQLAGFYLSSAASAG